MRNEAFEGAAGNGRSDETVLELTPTVTEGHRPRIGGFSTISEALDCAAECDTGFNFYTGRGALEHVLPYRELRERAIVTGKRLIKAGLKRGDRVAVVAETGPDFMVVFFGCQYAGLVPCAMPYTMYIGGKEAYIERITGMLNAAHAAAAISTTDLEGFIREAAEAAGVETVLTHEELAGFGSDGVELEPFAADEVAYIQYSSGSTSSPKGVLITQAAICANTTGILRHGMQAREGDRAFSWLPLYHDMGLVGFCLSPMMGQFSCDYLATSAFARRPVLWLKLMSDNGSTICYSPSFGYDLAGRRVNGGAADLDLSAWRIAGIGGDMVRADVLEDFARNLAPAKFNPVAFMPSYGMAETTLAITFTDCDSNYRVDVVDSAHCKLSRRAIPVDEARLDQSGRARAFVVCGKPLPDHEVKICDDKGRVLAEREIGHVLVTGPSLMSGYYENADATDAVMRDGGFMDTGDMGYWLDGELVITGRAKDLILHNGRNIWPQDIEWTVEQVAPLRGGDAAAFAVEKADGDDAVVVLAQCRLKDEAEMEDLRRQVSAAVHRAIGVECDIVLVPPRSLPFTSSGKLSRAGAKARYLAGDIGEVSPAAQGMSSINEQVQIAANG